VPQLVPFAMGVPVSMHCDVPVEHDVVPATHGFGFVGQPTPAAQAVHVPSKQTSGTVGPTSQVVPFARFAAVSMQVEVPVAQEVVPTLQGFGGVAQDSPSVQALHAPPLQTWFVPHEVPFAF
jgi:hypothetical protein